MASLGKKSKDISMAVNMLIKEGEGMFVAHCLELDVVLPRAQKTLNGN